jgi:predicted AAA+ superfamily ATPase
LIFKERAEKQVERPASRVGRHIEIPIHPLVYPEFLEFSGLVDADEAWGRFLLQGGMPGIHAISKEDKVVFEYLGAVDDTVVLKGVIQRHAIRNPRLLQQLLHFVLDTSGSPLSAKRIADYLKSQNIRCSVDTILEYLAFFVDAGKFLMAYAALYLNEEIRAEALTRNVGAFSRFLEVAARQNGQVTNVSNIARDAGVVRTTVQNYFEILGDTLLGSWLQPWKLKPGNKQVAHPKFYLFDNGVARALSGRLAYAPTPEECGPLLETLVGNEIRAYLERFHPGWRMNFWRTHDDVEVDFVVETDWGYAAVEVKAASTWRSQYSLGLKTLKNELAPREMRALGVFRGPVAAKYGGIEVLPVGEFLSRLWSGRVI